MKRFVQILVFGMVMLVAGMAMSDETGLAKKGEPLFYTIRTQPGEHLRIEVRGDGDGDIDCYLYNANGSLANKDNDTQDNCLIQGRSDAYQYRLKIVNTSDSYSLFSVKVIRSRPDKEI